MSLKTNYAFSFVYFVRYLYIFYFHPGIRQYFNDVFFLYYNTHHAAFAVIDDFLHGVLKFHLTFFSDDSDLAADAILY